MISGPVFRLTIRETVQQPGFLFGLILQLSVLLMVGFGLGAEVTAGRVSGLSFFSHSMRESAASIFVETGLPALLRLLVSGLVIVWIVGYAPVIPQTLHNPALGAVLVTPVSRSGLLLTRFAAGNTVFAATIMLFMQAGSFLLWLKTDGTIAFALHALAGAAMLSIEMVTIAAFLTLVAVMVPNPNAVALVGVAIAFVVGPLRAGVSSFPIIVQVPLLWLLPTFSGSVTG
jgi:hypothetical protein